MAATTAPLVWDVYRAVEGAGDTGGVIHYYDAQAQSIYRGAGLATRLSTVPAGAWGEAIPGDEISLSGRSFADLALDHPHNGVIYGAAVEGDKLLFLRYLYELDISNILSTGSWKGQSDSLINQTSLSVHNVMPEIFEDDYGLFAPGSRLSVSMAMGDSDFCPIAQVFLDDVDYDLYAATVPMSGRNSIGYRLKDQTFDENTSFTGLSHEVMAQILELAGITDYYIGEGTDYRTWTFKPTDTYLEGIQRMMAYYIGWQIVELPDGKVVVGYPRHIAQFQTNSVYQFHGGKEVIKRKTSKSADGAYTRVRVTGKDAEGVELTPVYADVPHYSGWDLGVHKTMHVTAPDGLTQEELQTFADEQAAALQYVGIGEQFAGPIRPQLLPGDIASIYYSDEESVDLGLVTSVSHQFGEKGYFTSFSVDSGGVATDGEDYTVTRSAALQGRNRTQKLADLIAIISKK